MVLTGRSLPDSNFASFVKDDVTVILSVADEPYKLDNNFNFATQCCLIYAESVEISASLIAPGKHLGIFCHDISIQDKVVINVSGKSGDAGANSATDNGEPGGNGADAGDVWVFVQNGVENTLKKLTIKAFGGDGGEGGDASAEGKQGGKGGDGGNGGHCRVWYGWTTKGLNAGLRGLLKKPWTQAVVNLLNGTSLPDIPKLLSAEQKSTVLQYAQLQTALQKLLLSLQTLDQTNPVVRDARSSVTGLLAATTAPRNTDGFRNTIESLEKAAADIDGFAPSDPSKALDDIVKRITAVVQGLSVQNDSELATVVEDIAGELVAQVSDLQRSVRLGCRFIEAGGGGLGGSGPIGANRAPSGKQGTVGTSEAVNVSLNGSASDLMMNQAFAFPEQCQMLLSKADNLFFTNSTEDRERASLLYTRLINRLSFLAADPAKYEGSNLSTAYGKIESTWKLTVAPLVTLKSVYEQAKCRLNRLLLGQDMWGHGDDWVPRLSIQFYDDYVNYQLKLLAEEEQVISDYEAAWKESRETMEKVNKGIDSMQSHKEAADAKIRVLTDENGPLKMSVYRIASFTPQLNAKRTGLAKQLRNVNLDKFDPQIIVEALSTLTGLKKDFGSLKKLGSLGYDLYREHTIVRDADGKKVEKKYVIDQLGTCADTLESLLEAFSTRKDHTIAIDDPGCIKILASIKDIKKIVEQFKNVLPQEWQKKLNKDLDEYVKLIQTRNDAVVEYNAALQLLAESLNDRDYYQDQALKLAQARTELDPNLPAIIYWLRKARDGLRLMIMQNLNYQGRAIRYWGLRDNIAMLNAQPLQDAVFLHAQQEKLHQTFADCLHQYATNVRNVWPARDEQQGLFKRLTAEQVSELRNSGTMTPNGMEYNLFLTVDPIVDQNTFQARIDIRLSQIRLWLIGADVNPEPTGRKLLSVQLIHSGDDDIQDERGTEHKFSHDPVAIRFDYDASKVASADDALSRYVFSRQQIQDDHYIGDSVTKSSIAALGPYTTWRVRVLESANRGLDLRGLKEAYLEFRGTSRDMSAGARGEEKEESK